MFSDRKASKVLGVTVLRAPRLRVGQETSETIGTAVVRSGVDWETRVDGGSMDPMNGFRKGFLTAKIAPLILGKGERERAAGREGQKVVLSPKRESSSRMLRRHTISYESGSSLLLPQARSSPKSAMEAPNRRTAGILAESQQEERGEGLDLSAVADDTVSETATLVDLGIVPLPVPSSRPPSPIDPPTPSQPYGAPVSPTARRNPMLQKRREMVRSANKSVQILGVEARRAILKRREKENEGRIGWSGV